MEKWKTQHSGRSLSTFSRCFPLSHRLDYDDEKITNYQTKKCQLLIRTRHTELYTLNEELLTLNKKL
jgi:hypothetical protein